jgi:hypothetical protein
MNTCLRDITIVIITAFTCSYTVLGSALISSNACPDKNQAGQPEAIVTDIPASSGVTESGITNDSKEPIITNPYTVGDGGRMTIISGNSIVFKPGTRVISGGYLHASIISDGKEQKPGLHKPRKPGKMADVETAIAPVVIAETHDAISPFAKKSGRGVSESDKKDESLAAQVSEVSGISPAQQYKLALHSITRKNLTLHRILTSCPNHFIPLSENHETIAVLRL